ncbi:MULTISPECIES: heme lyase CcmF/NrfE family subunit [Thermomonas]|jgi:cytochrome c-type biogenesis protein CcmF|uniref:Heme lyase CcmF/NrfE family subunit n=1 Tax=Thermomonas beijingensis TaxID=2872701 RepID=A0ABS7TBU9_9GAMM|nr:MULTISPECIES: heme lyase CcmF/NrfE family subunit [Thermomonas]MBS0460231.1 heme lyase CcmF/NrfE family subunit [Pseudomonadota bacterium]MBZ4185338.1 heme lyase CcmF/NrfE family subunit [Thermomonas beijingensis]HOC11086.1 heme lyase CcmF/NrfE family subunit [Thermomonas sp.]HQA02947.1 heme lyase CcmF/NrfE family subunit [Thermomonas sp.]HQE07629.1 heme lyase CcmF/NrfE family subunit [Thermomonas sp.]
MLPELGQITLILAFLVAALQALLPLLGAQRGIAPLMAIARPAAYMQLLLVGLAFAILTHAFVVGDFSVQYVAENSNSLLPMLYRYTAVWGAHEGSLLLWALVLALWTAAVARFSSALPQPVVARVLGVMGIVAAGFLAFLIFTSNPFARLLPAAGEGRDLNPLLQDPGLIMHPPMLYAGYVGFAVPFAFAIAALLERRIDAQWLRWTRPWTNAAWAFLTLGIAIGSWWAYYELGWGGWWFWDPVENASFMPWLAGAALLHSQAVTEKRGSFGGWTLLLAITAFSLSLLGTFLVRSGVLTSVHAFAADPGRGLFVLIFLGIVIGGSLLLYALRAPDTESNAKPFAAGSRETLLLLNNLLLACACAMVLLGTLYPLLADALELGKISVGPPYFAIMFIVLMAPLVALVPLGPLTRWQREQMSSPLRLLAPWAALAVLLGVVAFFLAPQGQWKVAAGVLGAVWVALGTLRFVWSRLRAPGGRMTREMLGMSVAHLGIAVFLIGALLVEGLNLQRELAVKAGDTVTLGAYSFRFDGIRSVQGPNYVSDYGTVQVLHNGRFDVELHPEKRRYRAGGQVMTESGIARGVFADAYVALGESLGNNTWALRVHVKPFVRWIWAGALLMALGAGITATDKRFRTIRKERA